MRTILGLIALICMVTFVISVSVALWVFLGPLHLSLALAAQSIFLFLCVLWGDRRNLFSSNPHPFTYIPGGRHGQVD